MTQYQSSQMTDHRMFPVQQRQRLIESPFSREEEEEFKNTGESTTMGYFASGWKYIKANPKTAAVAGTGAVLIGAPAVAAAPALALAGFGVQGVVAGSAAASTQSAIGVVAAKSVFATLTSAGAGGYGVAVVHGVVQGVGAAVVGGAGVKGWFSRGMDDKGGDAGKNGGAGGAGEPEKDGSDDDEEEDDNGDDEEKNDKV